MQYASLGLSYCIWNITAYITLTLEVLLDVTKKHCAKQGVHSTSFAVIRNVVNKSKIKSVSGVTKIIQRLNDEAKSSIQLRPVNGKNCLHWGAVITWLFSVDPVPTDAVVDGTSVSSNPDRSILYQAVRVTNYELLKHVVNILISNNRQRWVPSRTKLSCFIPTHQHWTIAVEAILLTVQLVTLWHFKGVDKGGR